MSSLTDALDAHIVDRKSKRIDALAALPPARALLEAHNKDIIRRSAKKNKFLMVLPGLMGPLAAGRMGAVRGLHTPSPVMYLEFPQVRREGVGCLGGWVDGWLGGGEGGLDGRGW